MMSGSYGATYSATGVGFQTHIPTWAAIPYNVSQRAPPLASMPAMWQHRYDTFNPTHSSHVDMYQRGYDRYAHTEPYWYSRKVDTVRQGSEQERNWHWQRHVQPSRAQYNTRWEAPIPMEKFWDRSANPGPMHELKQKGQYTPDKYEIDYMKHERTQLPPIAP
ncbi:unnamed protein product [Owenia fusiformis]|uniref:Uncharacterized protein n=1 Tax=Owenia fusiformis TaxID=6347 RepID=A0A8S4N2P9_OWEFU|nr:unnamed protein product [Owenia fusiformis]